MHSHLSPPPFPFSNIWRSLPVFIDFVSLIDVYIYTKVVIVVVIWNVTPFSVVSVFWLNITVSFFRTEDVKPEPSSVLKTEPEGCFRMLVFVCILCCLQAKLEFLKHLHGHLEGDNVLKMSQTTLQFCVAKGVKPPKATANFLPVLVHACPANFSTIEYFEVCHL